MGVTEAGERAAEVREGVVRAEGRAAAEGMATEAVAMVREGAATAKEGAAREVVARAAEATEAEALEPCREETGDSRVETGPAAGRGAERARVAVERAVVARVEAMAVEATAVEATEAGTVVALVEAMAGGTEVAARAVGKEATTEAGAEVVAARAVAARVAAKVAGSQARRRERMPSNRFLAPRSECWLARTSCPLKRHPGLGMAPKSCHLRGLDGTPPFRRSRRCRLCNGGDWWQQRRRPPASCRRGCSARTPLVPIRF